MPLATPQPADRLEHVTAGYLVTQPAGGITTSMYMPLLELLLQQQLLGIQV
jgi:hypothetical protein